MGSHPATSMTNDSQLLVMAIAAFLLTPARTVQAEQAPGMQRSALRHFRARFRRIDTVSTRCRWATVQDSPWTDGIVPATNLDVVVPLRHCGFAQPEPRACHAPVVGSEQTAPLSHLPPVRV